MSDMNAALTFDRCLQLRSGTVAARPLHGLLLGLSFGHICLAVPVHIVLAPCCCMQGGGMAFMMRNCTRIQYNRLVEGVWIGQTK